MGKHIAFLSFAFFSMISLLKAECNLLDSSLDNLEKKLAKLQGRANRDSLTATVKEKEFFQSQIKALEKIIEQRSKPEGEGLSLKHPMVRAYYDTKANRLEEKNNRNKIFETPIEIWQLIVVRLPGKDRITLLKASRKMKKITESSQDYSYLKAYGEAFTTRKKYVNAVIDFLNKRNESILIEIASLGYSLKLAKEIWNHFPPLMQDIVVPFPTKVKIPLFYLDKEQSQTIVDKESEETQKHKLEKDQTKVRELEFEGRLKGTNGYTEDREEAIRLNKKWAKGGDQEARGRECSRHIHGLYGSLKNSQEAIRLRKEWAEEGDQKSRKYVYQHEYKENPQNAMRRNNEWAEEGDLEARKREVSRQLYDLHEPEEAYRLMRKWLVIPDKIMSLIPHESSLIL